MVAVDNEAVESFKARFAGIALTPGDEGYDEARALWNGWFDKRPAVVAGRVAIGQFNQPEEQAFLQRSTGQHRDQQGLVASDGREPFQCPGDHPRMPLEEWLERVASQDEERGGLDSDDSHHAVPLRREEPRLADQHPRAVERVNELVTVLRDDRVLQLAGGNEVDLVGRIANVMNVLAPRRVTGHRGTGERFQLGGREALEEVRTQEQRDAVQVGRTHPIIMGTTGSVIRRTPEVARGASLVDPGPDLP